jgi:hypothetical protein
LGWWSSLVCSTIGHRVQFYEERLRQDCQSSPAATEFSCSTWRLELYRLQRLAEKHGCLFSSDTDDAKMKEKKQNKN